MIFVFHIHTLNKRDLNIHFQCYFERSEHFPPISISAAVKVFCKLLTNFLIKSFCKVLWWIFCIGSEIMHCIFYLHRIWNYRLYIWWITIITIILDVRRATSVFYFCPKTGIFLVLQFIFCSSVGRNLFIGLKIKT